MGHSESAEADPYSCFRTCAPPKRSQRPARPPLAPSRSPPLVLPTPPAAQELRKSCSLPPPVAGSAKTNMPAQSTEASVSRQAEGEAAGTQTGVPAPETKVSGSTNVLADSSCESPLVGACREASELLLGLQSKCSSRKVVGASHSPGNLTRASSSSDTGGVSGGDSSRWQRSGRPSARSRNLLLNKIEEIKQKYYEREL